MKSKSLLLLCTLLCSMVASAEVIDQAEALQVARDFFSANAPAQSKAATLREVANSNSLQQGEIAVLSSTAPTFYIFAPADGTGFVVVSGDDATAPILGYSLTDRAADGRMPCGLEWWCEAMNHEIAQLRAAGSVSPSKARRQATTRAAGEILYETAQWNQEEPYNRQCPEYGGSLCATGCVSTALAIIMRYYNYPTQGTGTTTAYRTSKGIQMSARDLNHTYDWDNMLLDYNGTYTDEEADAVATLMADIGYLLQADYGSSDTSTDMGLTPLKNVYEHFNYSSAMVFEPADKYSDDEWIALMQEQLQHGPVPYSSTLLGHQFLIDGYDSEGLFHVNWGWGGYMNGYYQLPSALYTTSTQYAVLNFAPDDGSTAESLLRVIPPGLSADTDVFATNVSFTLTISALLNYSFVDFAGTIAIGLTDSEGALKSWVESFDYAGLKPNYYVGVQLPITITTNIEPGDRLRMFYKTDTSGEWVLAEAYNGSAAWELVFTEENIGAPEVKSDYTVQMYEPGLLTDTNVYATNVPFFAEASPANISGKTISMCFFQMALTDEKGYVKEWISDLAYTFSWATNTVVDISEIYCTIKGDIAAGDRIRMFYQVNPTVYDDCWSTIHQYSSDVPWEIVITDDMIGEPQPESEYSVLMYTPGLSTNTDVYTPYVPFTADFYPANFSGKTIDVCHFRLALTNSNGNVKEWILRYSNDDGTLNFDDDSRILDYNNLANSTYVRYTGFNSGITVDIEAGDRIRLYYQPNTTDDDGWMVVGQYMKSAPWEVEITQDMIGDTSGIAEVTTADYGENDAIYTIQGLRVADMTKKGIYIVNGKKLLVK